MGKQRSLPNREASINTSESYCSWQVRDRFNFMRLPKKWFRILPAEVRGVPPASTVLGKWMI